MIGGNLQQHQRVEMKGVGEKMFLSHLNGITTLLLLANMPVCCNQMLRIENVVRNTHQINQTWRVASKSSTCLSLRRGARQLRNVANGACDGELHQKGRGTSQKGKGLDLIKTNMMLKDFGGNSSESKGCLNVELTVGSKTCRLRSSSSTARDPIACYLDEIEFTTTAAFHPPCTKA
uniref:Uncharacterized protein n=1 Tax=Oryza brachyantha TaxID=4533 RepID=J3LV52_ORYBR